MNVKRWLALLLALVLVFSLTACGKDNAGEDGGKKLETSKDYTGDWICVRMEGEGVSMSIKDMTEMEEGETTMNIASDGKLTLESGEAVTGTWTSTDTGIELTADDPEAMGAEKLAIAYDAAADTLTIDVEDFIMVFARKGSQAETDSRNTNYFDLESALSGALESEEYPQVTLAVGTPSTTTFTGETLDAKVNAEFTASKPGEYTFWAEGDQDTYATLYSDAEHLETLALGDDENGSNFVITCALEKGQTVYMEAGMYFTNNGDLTINVALAANAPVTVNGALDEEPSVLDGGSTVAPASVTPGVALPEGFVSVPLSTPTVAVQQDFWGYAHGMFVADQAGTYTVSAQSDADISLYVYDNADCLDGQLGYVDDMLDTTPETLTLNLQAGQAIYLESSYWGETFPANVTFTVAMAGGQAAAAPAPAATGAAIPEGFVVVTLDAPATAIQEDFWGYGHGMFTATQAGSYVFTAQSDADIGFYIYGDAGCLENQLAYADDYYDASAEILTLDLQAGQTVYLETNYYGENFPANVTFTATMAGGQSAAAYDAGGNAILTLGAPLVLTTSPENLCAYASFTAPSAGTYMFTVVSTEDATLFMYGDSFVNYGTADSSYAGGAEFLTLTMTAGQNAYLEIGTLNNTGTVVVAVTAS